MLILITMVVVIDAFVLLIVADVASILSAVCICIATILSADYSQWNTYRAAQAFCRSWLIYVE